MTGRHRLRQDELATPLSRGLPDDLPRPADMVAGVAVGLTLAGQLAVRFGATVNDPCGECDACGSVSREEREVLTAIFEANRMMCAEIANHLDRTANRVLQAADLLGFAAPKTEPDRG